MENDALIRKRTVLPRWRSTDGANSLLKATPSTVQTRSLDLARWSIDDRLLTRFRNSPDPSSALELRQGAEMLGDSNLIQEVDKFLTKYQFADKDLNIPKFEWDLAISLDGSLKDFSFLKAIAVKISHLRSLLRIVPNSALTWLEIGRHFVQLGYYEKAERACDIARKLSPQNVFILRSAIRCYAHIGRLNKALQVIEKIPEVAKNPWILPSQISLRHILDKPQVCVKSARKICLDRNQSDSDLSELRATLGMLFEHNGDHLKSKRYFKESLKHPNENSIGQLVAMGFQRLIPQALAEHPPPNSFEASARLNYRNGQWKSALRDSVNWLAYEPYSGRPAILGSFIAQVGEGNHRLAVELLEIGIRSNPEDVILRNNKIFSMACSGDLDEASRQIALVAKTSQALDFPALRATEGLISYRRNDIEGGRELYSRAIAEFTHRGDSNSARLALIYQVGEEVKARIEGAQDNADKVMNALRQIECLETRLALHRLARIQSETYNA